ncbi:MAG: response regulator [Spirochaetota bacterium]
MLKVLVVDDEEDVKFLFEQEFFDEIESGLIEMYFAFSGESALDFLKDVDISTLKYIITDISMPGMNGLDLLKIIKEKYPHINVIIITASVNKNNYIAAQKYGANDYIIKPIDFDYLKDKLINNNTENNNSKLY